MSLTVSAIVLAAGSSSRLGRNKQLIELAGETLVHRAVRAVLAAGVEDVVVVTGFEQEQVAAAVADLPCAIAYNGAWRDGMGTSVRAGLSHAISSMPDLEAVLVVLPDQVLVSASHLATLVARGEAGRCSIVASAYEGSVGVPALFRREHFSELLALPPEGGAKAVINNHLGSTATITNEAASVDVDTPSDLAGL